MNGSTAMRALLGVAVGLQDGRMNPGAELAWRPSQASIVSGTRSCCAPPCRRRSSRRRSPNEYPGHRSPRALTRPERRRQRQVAPPAHLAPILGYLLALQVQMEVSRDAGPGPIGEYLSRARPDNDNPGSAGGAPRCAATAGDDGQNDAAKRSSANSHREPKVPSVPNICS